MWTLDFIVPQAPVPKPVGVWLLIPLALVPCQELSLWDTSSLCALATRQPELLLGIAKYSKHLAT